uniref:Phosphatidylglycerophosphatase and protein-tyrosine phosphatase 1 n=1 Tax=Sarcophilus harrisii TaxID=9305 RepID=A0A7N4V3V4_SARHA
TRPAREREPGTPAAEPEPGSRVRPEPELLALGPHRHGGLIGAERRPGAHSLLPHAAVHADARQGVGAGAPRLVPPHRLHGALGRTAAAQPHAPGELGEEGSGEESKALPLRSLSRRANGGEVGKRARRHRSCAAPRFGERGEWKGHCQVPFPHPLQPGVPAPPLRSLTRRRRELIEKENVRAVITMNEEYETRFLCNTFEEWKAVGVEQLRLSTVDMTGVPTLENLKKGVQFTLKYMTLGKCVYVHCKAGRSRSATMVAAYLMQVYNWSPEEAVKAIADIRSHIHIRPGQVEVLKEFHKQVIAEAEKTKVSQKEPADE